MPAVFVLRILFDSFLPLPFDPSERREWTTVPVALVFTTAAQRRTLSITEYFCVFPALVPVTIYVPRGGPASARTNYLYLARRARPGVTR